MARTVQDFKLGKREQRLRLEARKKPYWTTINEGEHLGYYRGARVGKWLARFRAPGGGAYQEATLAQADDFADADGEVILNFRQAQDKARSWFASPDRGGARRTGPYTVGTALDDYVADFTGKDLANTKRRIEKLIRPTLGAVEIARLTSKQIDDWKLALARSPARLRTAADADQNYRAAPVSTEDMRRRQSNANRVLTVLKAALNKAFRGEKAASDSAWRRVKPFPKVDAPRLRYLSDAEARRLVNSALPDFRLLIQAALLTGARYAELTNLEVRDFDAASASLWLRETKAGVGRAVYLDAEGVQLFKQQTAGRAKSDRMFLKSTGQPWGAAHQARPMAEARLAAKIDHVSFHDLRRTYGARLALKGVPMAIIAEALGHADERITRKHYAHLSPSHVGDVVRAAVTGMQIVEKSKVVAIG
ncbi:hypothetical protein ASD67_00150 [Sphingopyxis sp. Root1497]|uniref:tyrosine-type recombinase/integrase n=1 Tax=Sphingopyxis sp. Root1497 TaxID=1736474 RepID=UPI0006F9EF35|nr:site-specific integrase [Sphingopyxis sp. Root1497]KQZ65567.1 hypothetical protein ASD67_00150 [Sphingopyxis sp. Root1497]